jgi:hypothetical protein
MRCTNCSTTIPDHAAYCPKCGRPRSAPLAAPMAPNAHPSTAPIPRSGKLFILFTLIGLGLLVAGFGVKILLLIYIGGAILALILLLAVIGDHVF